MSLGLDFNDHRDPDESEVQKVLRSMTSVKDLNESLFKLMCCYVSNAFHMGNSPEKRFVMYETISQKFRTLLRGMLLKENMVQELFRYLPNSDWPAAFYSYVDSLQEVPPKDSFYQKKKMMMMI